MNELKLTQQEDEEQHDGGLKTNYCFQFLLVVSLFCIVFFTECLLKRDAKWLLQRWDLH